jgi:hypothetical protein
MPVSHVGDLTGRLASILSKQELQLLTQTRDILEEILETVEVAGDEATVKRLREAQRDVNVGRVRPYKDLASLD